MQFITPSEEVFCPRGYGHLLSAVSCGTESAKKLNSGPIFGWREARRWPADAANIQITAARYIHIHPQTRVLQFWHWYQRSQVHEEVA